MRHFNFKHTVIAATTLLVATACNHTGDEPQENGYQKIQLSATEQKITTEANDFAFNLFKTLNNAHENDNTFISPYSMAQVLAMLANGAQGNTYNEIVKALGISYDINEVNSYYKHLREDLPKCVPNTKFTTSNFFVYNNRYSVLDEFVTNCTNNYGTSFKGADFYSNEAVGIVNKWVSDATSGKIPSLFEGIPANAGFCVVNATTFDGWWANPFDEKNTCDDIFHNYKNISEKVPMMFQDLMLEHYADSDFVSLLKIPYKGSFEMDILLPNRSIDINKYITEMTLDDFYYMLDNAAKNPGNGPYKIGLPKFKGEFNYDLQHILTAMGINQALSQNADFGKFSTTKSALGVVKQSASIDVDEHGTQIKVASGATGDVIAVAPNCFIVDSPFIYIIRECNSGAILFMGKTISIKQFSK